MGWGEIKKRCPRCRKLRRKVRDRRPERQWKRIDDVMVCYVCAADSSAKKPA